MLGRHAPASSCLIVPGLRRTHQGHAATQLCTVGVLHLPPETAQQPRGSLCVDSLFALDGLKSLFLNSRCGQPWISACSAHEDPREAIGLGTTPWCSVRVEVCAATATAPRSHGASGPSVPAASPPVVSPACGQAEAGLWTGGTQGEGGGRCSIFVLKRDGLLY